MSENYVRLYHRYNELFELLSDAECGRLVRSMLKFGIDGTDAGLRGSEKFAWTLIKQQMELDAQDELPFAKITTKTASQRKTTQNCGEMSREKEEKESFPPDPLSKKENQKTTPKVAKATLPPLPEMTADMTEALARFKEHRVCLRKPMTEYAVRLLLRKLERLAPNDERAQIALIDNAIEAGWQSVYPPKPEAYAGRKKDMFSYNQRKVKNEDVANRFVNLDEEIEENEN